MKDNIEFVDLHSLINTFQKMVDKKIVVWGTGEMSKEIAINMPFAIEYFIDSNSEKNGCVFCNKIVESPEILKLEKCDDLVIIIASSYFSDIVKYLGTLGINKKISVINGNKIFKFIKMCKNNLYNEQLREIYWNLRADDIYEKYKDSQEDKKILYQVLKKYKPNTILDIGCGEGRLMDLYTNAEFVVGQDISALAIDKCRKNYKNYEFTNEYIENLEYEESKFDLTISNRTLSAITKNKIEISIKNLCRVSKRIYVNEYQECEYNGECDYIFIHNYEEIFGKFSFYCKEKYKIGESDIFIFEKFNNKYN